MLPALTALSASIDSSHGAYLHWPRGQPVSLEESVERPGNVQRLGIPRDNDCDARSLHRYSSLAFGAHGARRIKGSGERCWMVVLVSGCPWQAIYRRCLYKAVANCISAPGRTRVSPQQLSRSHGDSNARFGIPHPFGQHGAARRARPRVSVCQIQLENPAASPSPGGRSLACQRRDPRTQDVPSGLVQVR
jgi:hypothetical protein